MNESYQSPLSRDAKRCRKCGIEKTLDNFYRNLRMRDGHLNHCKPCHNASGKRYYLATAEARRSYSRSYYAANKETQQAVNRKWNEANLEKRRAHRAKWRKTNPAQVRRLSAIRKARVKNAEGTHTSEELEQMYVSQAGLCAYCEVRLPTDFHLDHMTPISRGGRNDWTNLALTCPTCNLRKNDKTVIEFLDVWV